MIPLANKTLKWQRARVDVFSKTSDILLTATRPSFPGTSYNHLEIYHSIDTWPYDALFT